MKPFRHARGCPVAVGTELKAAVGTSGSLRLRPMFTGRLMLLVPLGHALAGRPQAPPR